jgi:glucan phosphoethanolaminetransferase (alkaline phosphatase superfamily)
LFALVTRILALLFLAALSGYFVYRSTAAHEILDSLALTDDWWPAQSALLGLSLLVLATLLLAAPMWAFAQRIRTSSVLVHGLRSFGVTVAVCGLLIGVVACPVAIYADRKLDDTLYQLVTNEPLHYDLEH